MKRVVFLCDGMADEPMRILDGGTPLDVARHPNIDKIAGCGRYGLARTIPFGMEAGSDVANLSVFGFDPKEYYTGRSPLEALSLGIHLEDGDVTYRCNFVTLSEQENVMDAVMIDYSAGEITTKEAHALIECLQQRFDWLYGGTSYRNLLVLHNASIGADLTPPHDISGKPIREYLPKGENSELLSEMIGWAYAHLKEHPINLERTRMGKNIANCVWFWGEGTKPKLPNFYSAYGMRGAVISAVDLVKGIGIGLGMDIVKVDGATGNYQTNYSGKGQAAIEALKKGYDYVYIHVEAPDECGHQHQIRQKIYSIEQIDKLIIGPVMDYLDGAGEDWAVLVMPDHPTPCALGSHTSDPVPYAIMKRGDRTRNEVRFCEQSAFTASHNAVEANKLLTLM